MEPTTATTAPQVVSTQAATPASAQAGVTGGDIFKILVHSFIAGFAIAIGVIVAVKSTGKKVVFGDSKSESGTMAMNGQNMMYPPRNMQPNGRPMPPMHGMMPRQPYMMATGQDTKFNPTEWIKRSQESSLFENEFLGNVRD